MIIELTTGKELILVNIDNVHLIDSDRLYFDNDNTLGIDQSYDQIKALIRQQKVNDLAERLFVKLTDSGCDYPIESAFQEAERFITEMEKRE